ncbi:redoxin domain-containing protein, partial [bacterium]|nr:redoxin domain-containing protein [bacterium]
MKLCVSVCLQVVLVGGLWGSVGQELDPEVLIDKYNSCNKKFQTIYYELETTTQSAKRGKRVHSLKYCSNNEKKQWIGHRTQYKEDGTVDQRSSGLLRDIYSDKWGVHLQYYNPELKNVRPPRANLVRSSRDKYVQDYTNHPPYGGSLTGRLFGSNDQSIYDLLKGASNLKLQNEVTKITGYNTYLVEADTKYGIVKAWISPDLDYNCLKWEIIKDQNQFYRDGEFTNDGFTKLTAVYDAEKVEQIDGQFVITQAKFNYRVDNGDIVLSNSTYHFNLTNIDLNPDYEALGAFKIQLPEGTVVTHEEVPGIQFRWTNGKFVPDMDDYLWKNLTGKPLPSLESFMKGLEQDYNKGKMVLVCFWDMQQRSSRNLVRELVQKEEELEDKSLIVFLVHTSDVTADELQKWIEENNIPFTSGRITGEYQKVLLHWGVRAQPWLILTDKQHIVRAEEFTISELDTHIEELSPSSKTMTDT